MKGTAGMYMTLKRSRQVYDASSDAKPVISAGRHEIERIPSPLQNGGDWLVLKGTQIGLPETLWRRYASGLDTTESSGQKAANPISQSDYDVIIEE